MVDGCQIVLRLAECDRPGRDGDAGFTAAAWRGTLHGASR